MKTLFALLFTIACFAGDSTTGTDVFLIPDKTNVQFFKSDWKPQFFLTEACKLPKTITFPGEWAEKLPPFNSFLYIDSSGFVQPTNITQITVRFDLHTNWTDASIETPVCNQQNCQIEHFAIHHQLGTVVTNKIVVFPFEGKTIEVFMGSDERAALPLKRDSAAKINLHLDAGAVVIPQFQILTSPY